MAPGFSDMTCDTEFCVPRLSLALKNPPNEFKYKKPSEFTDLVFRFRRIYSPKIFPISVQRRQLPTQYVFLTTTHSMRQFTTIFYRNYPPIVI